MSKHPVNLLAETEGMNGYQFLDWLEKRTDEELMNFSSMSYNLQNRFLLIEKIDKALEERW